ncbi:unnamed protein product [Gongylonema pulchrum]|uniref:Importin-11 n=1 Tax=Gongylonema pulchrum TaxID=637853 RepID=A0A183EPN2_9BILA|nr:unnamed protein product [Gongylonema pulchrum]
MSGLKSCGIILERELNAKAANIITSFYPICRRRTSTLVCTMLRRAMNVYIELLSSVIPKEEIIRNEDWFCCLEMNVCDESETIRKGAYKAAVAFFKVFVDPADATFLIQRIHQIYFRQLITANVEINREGMALLLGALPPALITANVEINREGMALLLGALPPAVLLMSTSDRCFAAELVDILTSVISRQTALDAKWAFARRSCVAAIAQILKAVGIKPLGDVNALLDWFVPSVFVSM